MNQNEAMQKMQEVLAQEEALVLEHFTNEDALMLGLEMIEKAKRENKAIAIDITRHNHRLFHAALEGTSADNDRWIARKQANCYQFGHSSLFLHYKLQKDQMSYEEKYALSSADFADVGGAMPVYVKSVGLVGAVGVSGLAHTDDHNFVRESLQWLKEKQN